MGGSPESRVQSPKSRVQSPGLSPAFRICRKFNTSSFTHVLFLINIYGAKVITSVLLDCFLFLAYSAIYYYVSFLIQLTEVIKTLILLRILLHIYGVAIARRESSTPLLRPQVLLLL